MQKRAKDDPAAESKNGFEDSTKSQLRANWNARISSENVAALCAELARLNTNTTQYLACAEILIHKRIDEVMGVLKLCAENASSSRNGANLENLIAHISQLMEIAHDTKESFSKSAEQQAILTSDALNTLMENLRRGATSN